MTRSSRIICDKLRAAPQPLTGSSRLPRWTTDRCAETLSPCRHGCGKPCVPCNIAPYMHGDGYERLSAAASYGCSGSPAGPEYMYVPLQRFHQSRPTRACPFTLQVKLSELPDIDEPAVLTALWRFIRNTMRQYQSLISTSTTPLNTQDCELQSSIFLQHCLHTCHCSDLDQPSNWQSIPALRPSSTPCGASIV